MSTAAPTPGGESTELRYIAALMLKHILDQDYDAENGHPLWSWTIQDAAFKWFGWAGDQRSATTIKLEAIRMIYEMARLLQHYVPDDIKAEVSGLLQSEIHNAVVDGGGAAL